MHGSRTDRYLFLFEKILLITKRKESGYSCKATLMVNLTLMWNFLNVPQFWLTYLSLLINFNSCQLSFMNVRERMSSNILRLHYLSNWIYSNMDPSWLLPCKSEMATSIYIWQPLCISVMWLKTPTFDLILGTFLNIINYCSCRGQWGKGKRFGAFVYRINHCTMLSWNVEIKWWCVVAQFYPSLV